MQAFLAQAADSPLLRIRRNAQYEAAFALLTLLVAVGVVLFVREAYPRVMALWLALVCIGSLYYLYQKLHTVNLLQPAAKALRQQLAQQVNGLRRLVQIYYRLTMLTLLGTFGIGFVMQALRSARTEHSLALIGKLAILLVTYGLISWLAYRLLQRFTRWYLQRVYGQHIDRLESCLHELPAAD
ncbi:hypothetical protein [Hymenobacter cavernae]|nr:hypothetical protein [Hymenobacter cavernae]